MTAAPTARPCWFDDDGLYGVLHSPPGGRARAGVLLVPSFAAEQLWAAAGLRALAERLAESGFVVLRFDWYGTGGSAGDLGQRWTNGVLSRSAASALRFLRSTRAGPIAVVAFGLGASTLAADALEGVTAVAWWSPWPSGRVFCRSQEAALRLMSPSRNEPSDEAATTAPTGERWLVPGFNYPIEGRRDVAALVPPSLAGRLPHLVLQRPGAGGLPGAQSATVAETDDLEDMLVARRRPVRSIDAISAWLDRALPAGCHDLCVPATSDTRLVPTPGSTVRERLVSIPPLGLAGVLCNRADVDDPGRGAPVVLLNTAAEPSSSMGRLWVSVSHAVASAGRPVLRVDLSGLGDSPTRPGQPAGVTYQAEAIDDIVDVAHWLAPEDVSSVALVGICSGGYNALEAGLRLHSRQVFTINPPLGPPHGTLRDERHGTRLPLMHHRRRWVPSVEPTHPLGRLVHLLPPVAWHALDALHLQPAAGRGLRDAASGIDRIVWLSGTTDARPLLERSRWIVEELVTTGKLEHVPLGSADHALLRPAGRAALHAELLDRLTSPSPANQLQRGRPV